MRLCQMIQPSANGRNTFLKQVSLPITPPQPITNTKGVKFGTDAASPRYVKQYMEEAGFVDVQEHILKLPIGPWARDPRLKKCGLFEMVNMTEGISGLTTMLFTRALNWSPAEVEVFLTQVRKEAQDKKIHSYYHL